MKHTESSYVSIQERTGPDGTRKRNTVLIRSTDGRRKAFKRVEKFGANGKVLKCKTRKLTAAEKKIILSNRFVHGLWNNMQTLSNRRGKRD
jgi:hypothetical protein